MAFHGSVQWWFATRETRHRAARRSGSGGKSPAARGARGWPIRGVCSGPVRSSSILFVWHSRDGNGELAQRPRSDLAAGFLSLSFGRRDAGEMRSSATRQRVSFGMAQQLLDWTAAQRCSVAARPAFRYDSVSRRTAEFLGEEVVAHVCDHCCSGKSSPNIFQGGSLDNVPPGVGVISP
ncbi:hypothetical protein HAX54_032347 [Datura stramonium]|uniref:Uncharacterized protein n=1 Tax=Datura stramonium TaxID=4076 RepID=A0ABS8VDQ2_DATST|nr:hypothetical protein [Datura stramonium]